jgi:hypothetical protein
MTGNRTAADPPVEVILLVDITNTPLAVVGKERNQIESFLRRKWRKADTTNVVDDLR